MEFQHSDLKDPSVYSWSAERGDNPQLKKIDSGRLDATEGYEVLSFLNAFAKQVSIKDKAGFQMAEELLRRKPGKVQGRMFVMQWMILEWAKHGPLSRFK